MAKNYYMEITPGGPMRENTEGVKEQRQCPNEPLFNEAISNALEDFGWRFGYKTHDIGNQIFSTFMITLTHYQHDSIKPPVNIELGSLTILDGKEPTCSHIASSRIVDQINKIAKRKRGRTREEAIKYLFNEVLKMTGKQRKAIDSHERFITDMLEKYYDIERSGRKQTTYFYNENKAKELEMADYMSKYINKIVLGGQRK